MAGISSLSTAALASGPPENGNPTNESEPNQKRIRACITCRNMKIKCVSVPGSKDCETCLRYSRPCQDPGPPKARVKTSQKFNELEKRIDALTSALEAERRRNQQPPNQAIETLWSKTPDSIARDDGCSPIEHRDQAPGFPTSNYGSNPTGHRDVVDQGLIDISNAIILYNYWNRYMRPLMPVVRFPDDEDINVIRKRKPTLFLTILTIASSSIRPSLVAPLLTQLNNTLAQDVFIQGTKSLDLLQSLILFAHYYIQPPQIKAFALPQHVYSAVVMSHDLGLGTVSQSNIRNNSDKAKETSRTLLAVYLGASCAATLLRRHQPFLFKSPHRDWIEPLMQTNGILIEDQWLCSLVTLQELFEDVSKTLNMSYYCSDESFDDFRTQHLLGSFRQRLADWKLSPSGNIDPRLKNHAASAADLYMHQVAVKVYTYQMNAWLKNKEKYGSNHPLPLFTATHTDALCRCVKAGTDALNIYLSLEDDLVRSLPNVFLIWNLGAAVGLIKLGHFIKDISHYERSGNDIFDPPSPSNLLEAVIQKLTHLSRNGCFLQARPFIFAFKKIKTWYEQKKSICLNSNGGCADGSDGPFHDILGTQTPPASPPATPNTFNPQRPTDDQGRSGNGLQIDSGRNEKIMGPGIPGTVQSNIDWNTNALAEMETMAGNGTAAAAFNTTYDPAYFNTDLGDFGFGLDDMRDIDNFMMQTEDAGLWSLL
ncbi:hypothetical protein M426DRAFT_323140 [Hypoxylon sp. CI-4A]|nr:hypothetical protein M426DRAFT_323140 [Hypoxylon sp. CI-4A]